LRLDLRLQKTASGELVASITGISKENDLPDLAARMSTQIREHLGLAEATSLQQSLARSAMPSKPEAARYYSEGLERLRQFEPAAAKPLLERSVAVEPEFPLSHSALAAAWESLGYDEKSQAEAKRAFDLAASLPQRDRLVVEGQFYDSTRQWGRAVDTYPTLFQVFPDSVEYGLKLAAAQRAKDERPLALETVNTLLKLPPPLRDDPRIAIYQQVPLRNAGPFLVAWLVARRLDDERRATWPLVFAAGLAAINNADFGFAALGATIAALVWTRFPLSRQDVRRLAGSVAIGLAGAVALVSAVTLVRAGALPDLLGVVAVARLYRSAGIASSPLPHVLGLPLVAYLTYMAAIGTATVRAMRREPDRTLTGMLAWSGIFGFGAAAYYVNASLPFGVPTLFPAWGLSLALLSVAAVRQIASQYARRPTVPALAALFGISLLATTLTAPPPMVAPWSQIHRLTAKVVTPPSGGAAESEKAEPVEPPQSAQFRRFVSSIPDGRGHFVLRRQAPVAFLTATGHLVAGGYGLRDVVPYTGESVFTAQRLDEAIGRLRAAGGSTVIVPVPILQRVSAILADRGFAVLTASGPRVGVPGRSIPWERIVGATADPTPVMVTKWVDMRAFASR